MRYQLTILLAFLLAQPVAAGVYKWVGPDGRVHYSDRPVAGAEPVAGLASDRDEGGSDDGEDTGVGADPGPYTAFEILIPEPNATLRNDDGHAQVSLLIDPPLSEDHRLRLLVDGQPVGGDPGGTQVQLQGLSYGSHQLRAEVLDDLEVPIAYTETVDFHLRRPLPEDTLP